MRTFGTPASDYGTACIETDDFGSLLLTGGGVTNGNGVQFGVVKTAYDGTLEWHKMFPIGSFSLAFDAVVSDNGYCILGSTGSSFNTQELFLMQLDNSGNVLWKYNYGFATNGQPVQLVKCKNGDLLCFAISNYNTGGYPAALLMRVSASGDVLWAKSYSGFNGVDPKALVELTDESLAFTATVRLPNESYPEHVLVSRLDFQGVPIWTKTFATPYLEQSRDLVANDQNDLFLVGQSYDIGNEWDGFLLKLDGDGNKVFDVHYNAGTFQGEIFRDIILTSDGSPILLGDIGGFNERNLSMLKVGKDNGAINWSHQYPLSPMFTNYSSDMYLSFNEGVVFTGDVRPPSYWRDAALFRANSYGETGCYTESVAFTTRSNLFESDEVVLSSFEIANVPRSNFDFNPPTDAITEKTICEDIGPLAFISASMHEDCPQVCADFACESYGDPTSWYWEFEGAFPSNSTEENPTNICFAGSGNFDVSLTISNSDGSTTIHTTIDVPELDCPLGEIPNIFTPNGDQVNDLFEFEGLSGEFHFSIVNRWGNLVFETSTPGHFWDGTNSQGNEVSEGVYFYSLKKGSNTKHGFIHVER
ncbi:MAG: gliding motility-associated C-terminal domain-containing protein [Fluviicola sp.]